MRFVLVVILIIVPGEVLAEISGKPRIVDGDTIEIGQYRIRLHGIDAPEPGQRCFADNRHWRCGRNATLALSRIIGTNWVSCRERDKDGLGRIVTVCNLAGFQGPNINAMMVAEGWAFADRKSSSDYVKFENGARRSRKGVWRGTFVLPWEWRKGKRLPRNDNWPPVADRVRACNIKGIIGLGGIRIFYLPGDRSYARARIDPRIGERWFCSEAEARSAGWRRSRQ